MDKFIYGSPKDLWTILSKFTLPLECQNRVNLFFIASGVISGNTVSFCIPEGRSSYGRVVSRRDFDLRIESTADPLLRGWMRTNGERGRCSEQKDERPRAPPTRTCFHAAPRPPVMRGTTRLPFFLNGVARYMSRRRDGHVDNGISGMLAGRPAGDVDDAGRKSIGTRAIFKSVGRH